MIDGLRIEGYADFIPDLYLTGHLWENSLNPITKSLMQSILIQEMEIRDPVSTTIK